MIIVRKTSIIIPNYKLGDCPQLERSFSIFDKLYHRFELKGLYYDEEDSTLYLPRGISVNWLEHITGLESIIDDNFDPVDTISPVLIKYLPRDEVQIKALNFILGNGDYLSNKYSGQLSVNLNTGAGKTYVSIAAASYILQRTIMITSSLNWIMQWKKCILEYTDTKESEIYILTKSASIHRLLNGMHDISDIKFILASHSTIHSYASKNGWDSVTKLFKFLKVGLKIYDEAHLYFDNICMIDFFTNTNKTIYLTATPARSDRNENVIYQRSIKGIPKIDLFNADTDPHTKYIAIHYNSEPKPWEIDKCSNLYGFSMLAYNDYIIHKPNFYKLLYVIVDLTYNMDGKILIYIGKNSCIDNVAKWMKYVFPMIEDNIGIYNSTIPKEIKEEQLSKKYILSTTKSCGAAMDIPNLKCTVVLSEPFASEVLARQTLGRTRAKNTYYIEVVDIGFSAINRYYYKKKKIFKKYAEECTDIHINSLELEEKFVSLFQKYQILYNEYIKNLNTKPKIEVYKKI